MGNDALTLGMDLAVRVAVEDRITFLVTNGNTREVLVEATALVYQLSA
jgi:hypothetical protein